MTTGLGLGLRLGWSRGGAATSSSIDSQYVGGQVANVSNSGSNVTINFALTGGLASTPAANDIVIVALSVGSGTDQTIGINTAGYTETNELFSDGSNLSANYKVMGGTPDSSVVITGTAFGGIVAIQVWRGINTTTPMDVTPTTATGIDNPQPNPPSITPSTAGSIIVAIGANAAGTAQPNLAQSGSELSHFIQGYGTTGSVLAQVGMGAKAWTGGAFDPVAWTGPTTSTRGWCAVCYALRPA